MMLRKTNDRNKDFGWNDRKSILTCCSFFVVKFGLIFSISQVGIFEFPGRVTPEK